MKHTYCHLNGLDIKFFQSKVENELTLRTCKCIPVVRIGSLSHN